MSKNVMRVDLSRQMEKTTNQQALIPHFGISGTLYYLTLALRVGWGGSVSCLLMSYF